MFYRKGINISQVSSAGKERGSGHPLKVKIFSAAQDYHSHYGNTFASLMKGSAEKNVTV